MTYLIGADDKPSLEELVHFGVRGMHWGVRKSRTPGVSARTDREAKKDAQEFARARAFFGEGAGTRRKLIKGIVEGKSKRDPAYKKAFDKHLADQDLATHVEKAKGERRRKDVKKGVGKTVRGTRHVLLGNPQYASAVVALSVGGALWAHRAGIDKLILNAGKKTIRQMRGSSTIKAGMTASDFFRTVK